MMLSTLEHMNEIKWPRPNDFQILFHPFNAVKLKDARCIWLNDVLCEEDVEDEEMAVARKIFADAFSYVVPGGVTFDGFEFDETDTKFMLAERYGGFGIGSNGGGARCGSLGPFQVKGCGKNLLAGPDQDVHHSYGGFKAVYAIHEALYASILETILPLGAARILGVILTGASGAYVKKDIERGWGALMVRDAVLRPANFLRARSFRPTKETRRVVVSDVARVRRANRELYRLLGSEARFDKYIKRFLSNCANQFIFARMMRLSHGAVTASNIAIDGRWLDLTNTSFSCSSVNTGGDNLVSPTFYEELYAPMSIARELIDTFAKYNGLAIESDWVLSFYRLKVDAYMSLHFSYLFGQSFQSCPTPPVPKLTASIMRIMSSAPTIHHRWPTALPIDDPMVCVIEALFLSMTECVKSRKTLNEILKIDANQLQQLLDEFTILLRTYHGQLTETRDWMDFLRRSFGRAIRRACMTEYFFKQRLGVAIDEHLKDGAIGELGSFMTASVQFGRWALAARSDDDLLFRAPNCSLSLSFSGFGLVLRTSNGEMSGTAEDILLALRGVPDSWLGIEGFSCTAYLSRVLNGLAVLERHSARDSIVRSVPTKTSLFADA
jgi:hypothetical protein